MITGKELYEYLSTYGTLIGSRALGVHASDSDIDFAIAASHADALLEMLNGANHNLADVRNYFTVLPMVILR